MKTLYFECFSGISGDMAVAALLDLGADEQVLRNALNSLNVEGYSVKISRVQKAGIDALDFDVILHQEQAHGPEHESARHSSDGHTHDHAHHFGHGHTHDHAHHSGHGHTHGHAPLDHGENVHDHRNLEDVLKIIEGAEMTGSARQLAKNIFSVVAEAEAKVHGKPVSEVHFHEVGAIDSIVDIVAAAVCIDNLGVGQILSTPLSEGYGTVKCQHGVLPVPAPATMEILSAHQVPVMRTQNQGEMVTPTGAAIIAALDCGFCAPGAAVVLKTGYGAGKKDFASPNVLRVSLLESLESPRQDDVTELCCNVDDMTGEQLAYAAELLMEQGALDCWLTPIMMKKGRPAQMLSVLVEPTAKEKFTRLLFLHTSTIGVRRTGWGRAVMARRGAKVQTEYGALDVKISSFGDLIKTGVEYESAKQLARAGDLPITEIYRAGEAAMRENEGVF